MRKYNPFLTSALTLPEMKVAFKSYGIYGYFYTVISFDEKGWLT